mgnify:CR=1 FL=1
MEYFSLNSNSVVSSTYALSDKDKVIRMDVNHDDLSVDFGENKNADIIAKLNKTTFDSIIQGKITFHRAFMTGDITAKGDFRSLRMLDEL